MRCSLNLLVPGIILLPLCGIGALAQTPAYNLGRTPTQEEIRAWDIAIGPEGKELPPGSGTATEGAKIFAQKCAVCHGPTGAEGPSLPNRWPYEGRRVVSPLLGGKGTLYTKKPVRTIGSLWPVATTVWDFINRSMPPKGEGTLSANEVYALTAFVLFQNGIIRENEAMDAKSLPQVQMPNRNGFLPVRPEWKPRTPRPFGIYP